MAVKMMIAFVVAFLISIVFGKFYVPWLKKHSFTQPLKDEVAQIYTEKENDLNKKNKL